MVGVKYKNDVDLSTFFWYGTKKLSNTSNVLYRWDNFVFASPALIKLYADEEDRELQTYLKEHVEIVDVSDCPHKELPKHIKECIESVHNISSNLMKYKIA